MKRHGGMRGRDQIPTVDRCMTLRPISIASDEMVGKALGMMFEHGIRHLPVVDAGRLAGILSDRDIGRSREMSGNEPRIYGDIDLLQAVSEVMSNPAVSVQRETPIDKAIKQMLQNRIGALPVVDSDNKLIGIFTETDALQYCLSLLERP